MRAKFSGLAVSVIVTAIMAKLADFCVRPGYWYSQEQPFRWQINAFLQGHFWILPSPFGIWSDGVWGRGAQIIWGLGVPLLQAPFEMLARLLHWKAGFPDRILFLIYLAITAYALWTAALGFFKTGNIVLRSIASALFVSLPLLAQIYVYLALQNFQGYEVAVLYSCLMTFLAVVISLRGLESGSKRWLRAAAFLCGFLPVIKVSYLFAGFFLAFGLVLLTKDFLILPFYSLGPLFVLFCNKFRFGAFSEFGYHLAVTIEPQQDLALRFGFPFQKASFAAATKELFGFLFGVQGADHSLWQSPVFRERQILTTHYHFWDVVILLAAWTSPLWFPKAAKKAKASGYDKKLWLLWIFSVGTFCSLFLFYLRVYAIASRYAVDFHPPIVAALLLLLIMAYRLMEKNKIALSACFALISVMLYFNFHLAHAWWGDNLRLTTADRYRGDDDVIKSAAASASKNHFPEKYECGDFKDKRTGLPLHHYTYGAAGNLSGWDNFSGECRVEVSTMFYFKDANCMEIKYQVLEPKPDDRDARLSPDFVEMKSNLIFMEKRTTVADGNNYSMKFCRPENSGSKDDNPYQMITIKWVNIDDIERLPAIKLISISKTPD